MLNYINSLEKKRSTKVCAPFHHFALNAAYLDLIMDPDFMMVLEPEK